MKLTAVVKRIPNSAEDHTASAIDAGRTLGKQSPNQPGGAAFQMDLRGVEAYLSTALTR
jgi:hypothetical protein